MMLTKRVRSIPSAWAVLCLSFFISGFAALIYQLCWQRALFAAVGVDVDSVTLIVSCFMLGIGIGGAIGGALADRFPDHRIAIYAIAEFGLGCFGIASLALIDFVSRQIPLAEHYGLFVTGVSIFALLLLPTILMGITLPVLTMAFDRLLNNIGESVGTLYFWNTLGAAFGAGLVPLVLFAFLPLSRTVLLAVVANSAAAGIAYVLRRLENEVLNVAS